MTIEARSGWMVDVCECPGDKTLHCTVTFSPITCHSVTAHTALAVLQGKYMLAHKLNDKFLAKIESKMPSIERKELISRMCWQRSSINHPTVPGNFEMQNAMSN